MQIPKTQNSIIKSNLSVDTSLLNSRFLMISIPLKYQKIKVDKFSVIKVSCG